ncbi:MAG: S41 family peptidase [Candidatus Zixiibacteriota bacterium]|nr:MAG: S41 family peptidase [candidate division Zixibacteria bacterium]
MLRYSAQLFGITIFALGLIWFAGPGDASQNSTAVAARVNLWADTTHINVDGPATESGRSEREKRDTFYKNIRKLHQAAYAIRNRYMEDIDADELIRTGIDGMLADLDRYSVLMEQRAYDALMESTHGRYSGLGMQIDARDNRIIIISPIEGTPAYRKGLRAGDVVWEIDGFSTEDMESSEAARRMRGEVGTSVVLTIKRTGIAEPLEFEVERALIELKSVNYAGLIPGTDIGYVRLSRFAEETSHELREAVSQLNEQNASSLIFDLRSNGGGLLTQAKETAELFLEEGREIVYTKGRDVSSERHYVSERQPLFGQDKPIIVLVDGGTASASEIVAGAIQDWDRGIILGSTTYGKGLVQELIDVSGDNTLNLKLTTAKYYVPSGRCIQKPERQNKQASTDQSELEGESDTLVVADKEIFYTNGGRIVTGGGGIVPDVEVPRETWKTIEINLERKSMFFDFAVKYVSEHPDVKPHFEVTDEIIQEFREFIESKEFSYKSALQVALEDLKEVVNEEDRGVSFEETVSDLEKLIELEKESDFAESLPYIKRAVKREIVSSIAGERGVYENIILKTDKHVQKAVELLSAPQEYSKLMTPEEPRTDL